MVVPPQHPSVLKNDQSSLTIRSVYKQVQPDYMSTYSMNCYANEVKWLRKLQSTGIVPQLLYANDQTQTFVMEYVGEPIQAATLPSNWEAQRDHILTTLQRHNCRHNDIKPKEILVQNGRLRLVDFGWASELNQPNPPHYPKVLGSVWKCPTGYNDRYSFDRAVHDVLHRHTRS